MSSLSLTAPVPSSLSSSSSSTSSRVKPTPLDAIVFLPDSWKVTSQTPSNWHRFREFIHIKSPLYLFFSKPDNSKKWEQVSQAILNGIKSKEYVYLRKYIHKILSKSSPEQLYSLLRMAAKEMTTSASECNFIQKSIATLLDLIPQEHLKTYFDNEKEEGLALSLRHHSRIAIYLKETSSTPKRIVERNVVVKIFQGVIDTLLASFMFFEINRRPGSSWEASHTLDIYARLFTFPLVILAYLGAIFSVTTALLVTVCTITALIAGISIYIKWLKPCPEKLIYCKNLTLQAQRGELKPVLGRDDEITQILNTLASSTESSRSHPLIIGKTQVGKNEIINGIAQWLADGNKKVPESLRGKKLFILNTAELMDDAFTPDTLNRLERLLKHIGKYKDKLIIVFNELQAATKNPKLSNSLLSVFDTSKGSLPHCIGITTTEEHEEFSKGHPSFAERFTPIHIKDLKEASVLEILRIMAFEEGLEENDTALRKIYEITKKETQPKAAKKKFNNIKTYIKTPRQAPKQIELENKIKEYRCACAISLTTSANVTTYQRIEALEKEKEGLEKEALREAAILQRISKIQKAIFEQKKQVLDIAHTISTTIPQKSPLSNLYVFKQIFLLPELQRQKEKAIEELATIGSKVPDINELIGEMLKTEPVITEKTEIATESESKEKKEQV